MKENVELVQRGFRILLPALAGFVAREMNIVYRGDWWSETLSALNDQMDLPYNGEYGELVDSLDIANCIRLIDRRWNNVFRNALPQNCRNWAKELMGVRNQVSHIGMQDIDQPAAERALDTMVLLCREIDPDTADELREVYLQVRGRADGDRKESPPEPVAYTGIRQPAAESRRGALKEGSLLQLVGTSAVQKTTLTRKVTYAGKTMLYPVYRVSLDMLYYNDQNDRIATWITRYESENGVDSLKNTDAEEYNRIIEGFILDSNPDAISKTQRNMEIVGQLVPGVTLADGRIVDGNRRYTCLRRMQREHSEPLFFETVIMDVDMHDDRKQIKLLELYIQHGEEEKVGYDLIDYAVGTYRDVVLTGLLTIEEYARSANESQADVKKRIAVAELICEFLEYIHLPEQYHVARDYQVYELFKETLPLLRQLDENGKQTLKHTVFNNVMMKAIPDQRKFIRDLKNLVKNGCYNAYFEDQKKITQTISEKIDDTAIDSKSDIERIAAENSTIVSSMQVSNERALLRSRSQMIKNKPDENVQKSIDLLSQIDPRLFGRLDEDEKTDLKSDLERLGHIVETFLERLQR